MDNGKAFAARFFNGVNLDQAGFSGLFARLGIKTIFAWPYHAQSKPVERFFATFAELERWMPSYTGTSIENKPPRLKRGEKLHRKVYDKIKQGSCLTLAQAHMAIATWFDEYAGRKQRGHLNGRKPIEIFTEEKGPGVDPIKLRFLMMSQDIRNISRNGIRFLGDDYYAPALYGRRHPVVIQYDLHNLNAILVFESDGETFICEATKTDKIHPAAHILGSEEDKRKLCEAIALKRRQERSASVSARTFLEKEVFPEHRRRLEDMGIKDIPEIPGKLPEREPGKLTKAEDEHIKKQVKEREEWMKELPPEPPEDAEYIPVPIEETPDMWSEISRMEDLDRYKKLIELEVRDWVISKEQKAWMYYFEQTIQYKRFKEYLEKFRVEVILALKCGHAENAART